MIDIRHTLQGFLWLIAVLLSPVCSQTDAQDAGLRGFVSVEPFEIRLEALLQVSSYAKSWGVSEPEISSQNRQQVLDNVATLAESGVVLRIEGTPITFTGRELRFVRRDPESGYVTDDRESIPVSEAIVGVSLSSGTDNIATFEVEWLWYPPGQEQVVVEISSRGRPSGRFVSKSSPSFTWEQEELPPPPTLLQVPAVEQESGSPLFFLVYIGGGVVLFSIGTIIVRKQQTPSWAGTLLLIGGVCAAMGYTIRQNDVQIPTEKVLDEITYRILRNIYHAFDFRDESSIYDTLEKSVTGPLLEKVYLEIRGSLELETSGGPRVKVFDIALREADLVDTSADIVREGITIQTNWATVGEVSHWGHTHERTNRYEARLTFIPDGERWKLRNLDLQNEERVQKVSRNQVVAEPLRPSEGGEGTTSDPGQ